MGWCYEFGPQIREGCDHPMAAGVDECHCDACGARCPGRFKGCRTVWARRDPLPPYVAARVPAPAPTPPPAVDDLRTAVDAFRDGTVQRISDLLRSASTPPEDPTS